jgi:hypothetical protein
MTRLLLAAVLAACGSTPPPKVLPRDPGPPPPLAMRAPQARHDVVVTNTPMQLAIAGGHVLWTDSTGAIWTMRIGGQDQPQQLSDQKLAFAFSFATAGNGVYASSNKDLLRVGVPQGPVELMHVKLPDMAEELVGDEHALYCTIFKRNNVMRIPVDGGAPQTLFEFPRGVLAVHEGTLYAVSYTTGTLVSIPVTGGKPKTVATGFVRPTALAVDDAAIYVYSEKEETLTRFDLAAKTRRVIARELNNADWLVADGEWLYTVSWPSRLLRVPKNGDGSQVEELASDLHEPYGLAVDGEAVYVSDRGTPGKVVRIPKP